MPTIRLIPMTDAAYADFLPRAIERYADDNIVSGRWPADTALARSAHAFASLLPDGVRTRDHFLYEIVEASQGSVGGLWFGIQEDRHARDVHVFDLQIAHEHRRKGFASAAFALMEAQVRELGIERIGLHVFAQNEGAQSLYRRLGYGVRSVNMMKQLDPDRAMNHFPL